MRKTVDILGVSVDEVTMSGAMDRLAGFLKEDRVHAIYTPNALITMEAHRDEGLRKILNEADLVVADGAGVLLAGKLMGKPLPEKVSGFDIVKNSFSMKFDRAPGYFFLGSKPGIAEEAGKKILELYPDVKISGCHHGYFKDEDEAGIIEKINSSGADILLAALGAPKQEKFIHAHKNELKVKVCIGVGGVLDAYAGTTKLAPEFYRRHGLEWLYRMCSQPKRFKKLPEIPKFLILAFFSRFRKNKV